MDKGQVMKKEKSRDGKSERMNLREIEEAKKIRNLENESKFKKFCGSTDFVLDLPNIDESVKFLKYDVDNEILNFNYTTMILNEKIERLNDAERNIYIPMDLPISYSFNIQNNDDIHNWIKEQKKNENQKHENIGGSHNQVSLTDKMKEISSPLPIVHTFEKDDFELLNRVFPQYIKSIKSNLSKCEEKKNRNNLGEHSGTNEKNTNDYSNNSSELKSKNVKRKISYNHYFQHPLKKHAKVKNIYPVLPNIPLWNNTYIQGIMEIGNSNDYMKVQTCDDHQDDYKKLLNKSSNPNGHNKTNKGSNNNNGILGLLHLVEKNRDKHLYGLYKKHDIHNDEYLLKKFEHTDKSIGRIENSGPITTGNLSEHADRTNRDSMGNEVHQRAHDKVSAGDATTAGTDRTDEQRMKKSMDSNPVKKERKKISLSKFLIKKYILKLKKREKLKNKLSNELEISSHATNKQGEIIKSKDERSDSKELQNRCKHVTFNNTEKCEYIEEEKKKDTNEHEEKSETVLQKNIPSFQNNQLYDNMECFKYVRDYKTPSFAINENDPLSYVIGFNKNNLAFIFPIVSRKIIFSKTGQQKRKNYILLTEE
ncbi:hypothetical protein, conserved [Plasmodium gonderi]|uniref:Uncharacterized protein n=1 Tax=Plasmodium gonderi TaxID=77519 RepID=A0A1Y1JIQ8_PLAGO|nr:hypothetical protein, conserved [Plasmodium gonderi]GAW82110.1 hypothetical protein, conserved [Plasmodium gonderi]